MTIEPEPTLSKEVTPRPWSLPLAILWLALGLLGVLVVVAIAAAVFVGGGDSY